MFDFKHGYLVVLSMLALHNLQASYSQPHSRTGSLVILAKSPVASSQQGWQHVLSRAQSDIIDELANGLSYQSAQLQHHDDILKKVNTELTYLRNGLKDHTAVLIPLVTDVEQLKEQVGQLKEQVGQVNEPVNELVAIPADGTLPLDDVQSKIIKHNRKLVAIQESLIIMQRSVQHNKTVQLCIIGAGSLYFGISTVVAILMFAKP